MSVISVSLTCFSTHWCDVYRSKLKNCTPVRAFSQGGRVSVERPVSKVGKLLPILFKVKSHQFQGICYNLYGLYKIVFTCLFNLTLEFLVTRVRVECWVVFVVRLCLLYTNVMCNYAFGT